jgi:multiple sugar transport system substrate-binding protein
MAELDQGHSVSRRTVLKGLAGTAGLVTVPAIIAACSPSGASTAPSAATSAAPSAGGSAAPSAAGGEITFGSNYSDEVPKNAMQAVVDAFTAESGINVSVNTVDHGTFQDQISSYLQGTPDDAFTWFAGFRMKFFAAQGLATDISDVWGEVGSNYSEAFKTASTGDDGKQYFIPFYNYPWVVIYRKSLFTEKGYTVPTTIAEFTALGDKMKTDGLVPMAFGDSDGWPAMGTFDILNMRLNGYQFHVGLMEGTEKWSDPKVKAVFEYWRDLLPYFQEGAPGRTWQDAAKAALVDKTAGMYFLGTFAVEQAGENGADVGFFPFPLLGTEFDAENAIDAPIDGFMLSANPKNPDAAKAFLKCVATPEAQVAYVTSPGIGSVAVSPQADTSKYTDVQKASAEVLKSAGNIAQFLDRDARADFAGPSGMQGFLISFLTDPNQDLDKYLGEIQAYYDTLPPQT